MTASATSSVQNLTQNYFNISDVTKINNNNNTNSNNINTNKIPFVNLKNSLISGTSLSALSISPSIKTTTTTTVLLTESITGRTLGLSSSSSSSSSRTTTTPDVLGIISQKPPSLPTPLKQFQLTSLSSETVAGNGVVSTSILTTYTTGLPPPSQLTTIPIQQNKTTATIITNSKRPTIIIYPTVTPESIVIPIVSCILGFPLLALLVICCLRRRAKLARERDRRRNYDMQDHAVSLVRFSPIHRLNNRSSRAISLRPERSLSRGFPSLELDTVIEERSDPEQTQTDILSPESPSDPLKYRDFNSS